MENMKKKPNCDACALNMAGCPPSVICGCVHFANQKVDVDNVADGSASHAHKHPDTATPQDSSFLPCPDSCTTSFFCTWDKGSYPKCGYSWKEWKEECNTKAVNPQFVPGDRVRFKLNHKLEAIVITEQLYNYRADGIMIATSRLNKGIVFLSLFDSNGHYISTVADQGEIEKVPSGDK